jgi:hypothetical protein
MYHSLQSDNGGSSYIFLFRKFWQVRHDSSLAFAVKLELKRLNFYTNLVYIIYNFVQAVFVCVIYYFLRMKFGSPLYWSHSFVAGNIMKEILEKESYLEVVIKNLNISQL